MNVTKPKDEKSIIKTSKIDEEIIKDLTKSVGLLPEFIIEPLKDYIKQEVTYRMAEEFDFLIEKKIEPINKANSMQHFIIMVLIGMMIITLLIVKIV